MRPTFPARSAVARQPALREDPLRHAVSRDELDVLLEHRVVQRLPIPAANEIRPEALEHVLERKRARPFPDSVRDRHICREDVATQHVVRVRPVVREVDDTASRGRRSQRLRIRVVDATL